MRTYSIVPLWHSVRPAYDKAVLWYSQRGLSHSRKSGDLHMKVEVVWLRATNLYNTSRWYTISDPHSLRRGLPAILVISRTDCLTSTVLESSCECVQIRGPERERDGSHYGIFTMGHSWGAPQKGGFIHVQSIIIGMNESLLRLLIGGRHYSWNR